MDNKFLIQQSAKAWINQQDLTNKTPEDVYLLLKNTMEKLDEKYSKSGFDSWK